MEQPESIDVPIAWVGLDEAPVVVANQFLIQHQPNEFTLTVGQMTPPPLLGTPEEKAEQARQIDYVPIRVLVRLGLSPTRLRELIAVLQGNLDLHDKTMEGFDPRQQP